MLLPTVEEFRGKSWPTQSFVSHKIGEQAETIVSALRDGNFSNTGISVVLPDVAPSQALQPVEDNKSAEGAAIGAGTGGVIGGVLGWLVGIGALALPGIGLCWPQGRSSRQSAVLP